MEHETISRYLYLQLIQDGIRVDRTRALVEELIVQRNDTSDFATRKLLKKIIQQIRTALQDTPAEQLKLLVEQVKIERAEQEYLERARRASLRSM